MLLVIDIPRALNYYLISNECFINGWELNKMFEKTQLDYTIVLILMSVVGLVVLIIFMFMLAYLRFHLTNPDHYYVLSNKERTDFGEFYNRGGWD